MLFMIFLSSYNATNSLARSHLQNSAALLHCNMLCCFYGSQESQSYVIALTAGLYAFMCKLHLDSAWFCTVTIVSYGIITSSPACCNAIAASYLSQKCQQTEWKEQTRQNITVQNTSDLSILLIFLKSHSLTALITSDPSSSPFRIPFPFLLSH